MLDPATLAAQACLASFAKLTAFKRLQVLQRQSMSPAPISQKTQKNYRLTVVCARMMQQLANARGIAESALVELLVRDEYERRGFRSETPPVRSRW